VEVFSGAGGCYCYYFHIGGFGGVDSLDGVFYCGAAGWGEVEFLGGFEECVRGGLAVLYFFAGDEGVEVVVGGGFVEHKIQVDAGG